MPATNPAALLVKSPSQDNFAKRHHNDDSEDPRAQTYSWCCPFDPVDDDCNDWQQGERMEAKMAAAVGHIYEEMHGALAACDCLQCSRI